MAVRPEDDHFHDYKNFKGEWDRSRQWWNESGWFNFHIPERELSGIFYVHHRPANGALYAGTALWDPYGDQAENCLYYDWRLHLAPEKCDMFTFELPNSFKLELIQELKTFHFTYDNDGFKADLFWEAFTPAQDQWERALPDEWMEWTTSGHFEQFGTVKGEIQIGSEKIEVDDLSARDHSWGPHKMENTGRGTFTWGIVDQQNGFFPYVVAKEPVPTDPIFDTVDVVKGGWYLKDGEIATLVEGERTTLERDDDGRPWKELVVAKDSLGREFRAEGEIKNHLFFQGFPDYWWWWCLTDWTVNGEQAWGETQDAAIQPHWRRVLYDRNRELGRRPSDLARAHAVG